MARVDRGKKQRTQRTGKMRKECEKRERANAIQAHAQGKLGGRTGNGGSDTNAQRDHRHMAQKLLDILAERQLECGGGGVGNPEDSFSAEVAGVEKNGM